MRENDSTEPKQWQGAGTMNSKDIFEVESTRLGDQFVERGKEEDGLWDHTQVSALGELVNEW